MTHGPGTLSVWNILGFPGAFLRTPQAGAVTAQTPGLWACSPPLT